jgi:hypothetical protein
MDHLIGKKGSIKALPGLLMWEVFINDPTLQERYGKHFAIPSQNLMEWMEKLEIFTDEKGHTELQ